MIADSSPVLGDRMSKQKWGVERPKPEGHRKARLGVSRPGHTSTFAEREPLLRQAVAEDWTVARVADALSLSERRANELMAQMRTYIVGEKEMTVVRHLRALEPQDDSLEEGTLPEIEAYRSHETWHYIFLRVVAKTHSMSAGCRAAGVTAETIAQHRARDPQFHAALMASFNSAVDDLVQVAHERAKAGADQVLMFLLKSYRPETYRETLRLEMQNRKILEDIRQLAEEQGLPVEEIMKEAYAALALSATPGRIIEGSLAS